jgi:6-phosphogluconolactonase
MPAPVRVLPDTDALSDTVASQFAECVSRTLEKRERFSLALAGGKTPKALYQRIADRFGKTLPWSRIHLFWGDERYVPHDDSLSNFRMVRESLLDRIDIPSANIHDVPTGLTDPDEAARQYESSLRDYFLEGNPRFDLILLGMGADGHTASLFPGTPALQENRRWVVPVVANAEPRTRLSMTMPVILQAERIYFLITGKDKAAVLSEIFSGVDSAGQYPAARVLYATGPEIVCWTDSAASSLMRP